MHAANAHPGADTIAFAIMPAGVVHRITPATQLPDIVDPVAIEGYTQPGSAPNTRATGGLDARPLIEIDGQHTGNGLFIFASQTALRGLMLHSFSFDVITIGNPAHPVSDVRIEGNLIGFSASGPVHRTSDIGIAVSGKSEFVRIGGLGPEVRNAIAGNISAGIVVGIGEGSPRTDVTIAGNLIGTTLDGMSAAPNGFGIVLGSGTVTVSQVRVGGHYRVKGT